ncbi:type VI secretion system baseplate subunit TssF [Burkholderia multivorans]|nr:type VI secretion system baseplate subunit TssF [Burkholderia multivorans]MBU9469267.1 type VI secretion system baseplate subunit TssF [Burkholderia multivorans]MCA8130348.1 type VI secretion system baseplate subunit TssF [Burkholderia multivorans]
MYEKLRGYYEQELARLQEQFATFGTDYPKIAAPELHGRPDG